MIIYKLQIYLKKVWQLSPPGDPAFCELRGPLFGPDSGPLLSPPLRLVRALTGVATDMKKGILETGGTRRSLPRALNRLRL